MNNKCYMYGSIRIFHQKISIYSSYILNGNSKKLCMLTYYHMKICISLQLVDETVFECSFCFQIHQFCSCYFCIALWWPSLELFQLYFLIITDIPNSILLLIKGYKMNGDVSQGDGSTGGGANSTKPLNLVSSYILYKYHVHV
jgi:hypothetical protein